AELCAPTKFEDLSPDGRALARITATLEYVIDTAPKGFYADTPNGPRLEPGRLLNGDEGIVWGVYTAYIQTRDAFRKERKGVTVNAGSDTSSETNMESSESAKP